MRLTGSGLCVALSLNLQCVGVQRVAKHALPGASDRLETQRSTLCRPLAFKYNCPPNPLPSLAQNR